MRRAKQIPAPGAALARAAWAASWLVICAPVASCATPAASAQRTPRVEHLDEAAPVGRCQPPRQGRVWVTMGPKLDLEAFEEVATHAEIIISTVRADLCDYIAAHDDAPALTAALRDDTLLIQAVELSGPQLDAARVTLVAPATASQPHETAFTLALQHHAAHWTITSSRDSPPPPSPATPARE